MPGAVLPLVRIQAEDFDAGAEIARLSRGAVATSARWSRFPASAATRPGTLAALELEHYPGMAEAEISRIADEAIERWPLTGLTAIHRYGKIAPGENIVLVVAASAHRQAAFEAASS